MPMSNGAVWRRRDGTDLRLSGEWPSACRDDCTAAPVVLAVAAHERDDVLVAARLELEQQAVAELGTY
jgi:hypothetical protein